MEESLATYFSTILGWPCFKTMLMQFSSSRRCSATRRSKDFSVAESFLSIACWRFAVLVFHFSLIPLNNSHTSASAVLIVGVERTEERLAHTALRRSYSTALFGSLGLVDGMGDGSSASFSGSDSLSYAEELSSVADSEDTSDEEALFN